MPRGLSQPRNHPRRGSSIKVEPIRDRAAINRIKTRLLSRSRRDHCLFVLGINTAYRASELLSLTVQQMAHLQAGDLLDIKQTKNKKYRTTTVNNAAVVAVQAWLKEHPKRNEPDAPLFLSRHGNEALCVSSLNRMVKGWCKEDGLSGNYGSHSLRKTWGYHQRKYNRAPLPLLMAAFGHSTEAQTLAYLHIQERELRDLYLGMVL